jgi:hypothetical protein
MGSTSLAGIGREDCPLGAFCKLLLEIQPDNAAGAGSDCVMCRYSFSNGSAP